MWKWWMKLFDQHAKNRQIQIQQNRCWNIQTPSGLSRPGILGQIPPWLGTYNLLESAKNLNIKKILITSTSETFGTGKIIPMNEEHPINAQSPYAASKIAADQLALSYHKSFKLPVTIIKPFNTYGPRQSARALIPSIIIQCLNKNKKIKIGNLKPTRDLTYVGDTCNAFLEIFKTAVFKPAKDKLHPPLWKIGFGKSYLLGSPFFA